MTKFTYRLILLVSAITIIGVATIYSCTHNSLSAVERSLYLRQIIWFLLALICLFSASKISYRKLWDVAYVLYVIGVVFLLLVAFFGLMRLGAQRWIKIFWFNFQPSELMKLIVVILLSRYFSRPSWTLSRGVKDWGFTQAIIIPFAIISAPILLILIQPDLGTAVFIFFIFMLMLFAANVNLKFIVFVLSGLLASFPLFWHFLKDYQRSRLLVFMNPNADPLGAGYTVIQSKIALASGGLWGKGWLGGSQSQLHFLPESHTDFIFPSFAEEWGFVGSLILMLLYYVLIRSILKVAGKASDKFGYLLASGIGLSFSIQVFINIAMATGFAPVVGLPLPLLSYGGSSLLVSFLSLGILINIENRAVLG